MSLDAMRWAFQQKGLRSSVKFVLVALAERAGEDHECWPSLDRIQSDTNLNRHTIVAAIQELEKVGLIERRKRYSSTTVYRLVGVPDRSSSAENNTSAVSRTSSSAVFSTASSAKNSTLTVTNLPLNHKKPEKAYAFTGETVRITTDDFARLAIQYPNLDLATELPQLDLELRGKRSWWNPLNAKLNYRNKNHGSDRPGRSASTDGSAAGRVRAEVERARAARAAAGSGGNALATDGLDVRNPLDGEFRRCG
jgi:hypothetical protein